MFFFTEETGQGTATSEKSRGTAGAALAWIKAAIGYAVKGVTVKSTRSSEAVPESSSISTAVINVGFSMCSIGARIMLVGGLLFLASACLRASLRAIGIKTIPQVADAPPPGVIDVTPA